MFKLEMASDGRVRCTAADTEGRKVRVTSPQTGLADGTWHWIGCVRAGSAWGVVADGVATFEHATLGVIENDLSLSIGSKYGTDDLPHGAVDDVRLIVGGPEPVHVHGDDVWERVLRGPGSRPVGHWTLDEAAGSATAGSDPER